MHLAIVIINYKTPGLTEDCLHSLGREREAGMQPYVVLVDNASNDGSVEHLQKVVRGQGWEQWVTLLESAENRGFAGGNNLGVARALEWFPDLEYVLFLNSDTVVHPGCLAHCRKRMQADPSIGILSCNVLNADGSVQNVCRKLPRPALETLRALGLAYAFPRLFGWADLEDPHWDRMTTQREVEWVGGAFMYVRAELIRGIGGLDEDFFFYGEDMEFCHRARRAGWRIFFDPAGTITHLGGASSDAPRLEDRRRSVLRWQARFLVQRKCYGVWAQHWVAGMYLLGSALRKYWLLLRHGRSIPRYQGAANALEDIRAAKLALGQVNRQG